MRSEAAGDAPAIRAVNDAAFAVAAHASGTEGAIVDALREEGALSLSLVAERSGEVVGHVAFSPVTVGGRDAGWFGLGPVSVRPDRQGEGIGSALIREGLKRLGAAGARGCVVLGEPGYYRRFGFVPDPEMRFAGVPPEYFLRRVLAGTAPEGEVVYRPAFHGE